MKKQVVVVNMLVINEHNQLLLTRRALGDKQSPNCWSLPGGTVELGETLQNALYREIKEELHVQVSEYKIFNVYDYMKIQDVAVYAIYFIGKISGNIELEPRELSEYRWFDPNTDLLDLDFAFNQKDVISDFLKTIT